MKLQNQIDKWLAIQAPAVSARTHQLYLQALRTMDQALNTERPSANLLCEWAADLRKQGQSGRWIAWQLAVAARFVNWMAQDPVNGVAELRKGDLPRIRVERFERAPFTENDFRRLLVTLQGRDDLSSRSWQPYWQPAVLLAWHAGLRCSDVARLPWSSVDLVKGELNVYPKKKMLTREKLTIPIAEPLRAALLQLWSTRDSSGLVLPLMAATHNAYPAKLAGEFAAACKAAGLAGLSFHSLRHGFVTRLLAAGVDVVTIASMTGQTLEVLQGYAHVDTQAKRRALERAREVA
jgi:integrase